MAKKRGKTSKLKEVLRRLNQIMRDNSLSNVRDNAKGAREALVKFAEEMKRKCDRQISKRHKWRGRLLDLLHDLSTGAVILPRTPGKPVVRHDELLMTYHQLRTQDFLDLAQVIQEAVGKGDVTTYQHFLVKEVLVNGSRRVVWDMVSQPSTDRNEANEGAFLEGLGDRLLHSICSGLTAKWKYQVPSNVREHIDHLLAAALRFLTDLLTATPPSRLVIPRDGSPFDPTWHEPIFGRPKTGDLEVKATLFPGYVVLENPPRIVVKAQVYTARRPPIESLATS